MANLNKVMLIGRLTRDPEVRTLSTGGKVAHFGFAVNNRRKNSETGQWEEDPVFIDIDAWNRGETGRQLADLVQQYLRKGHQAFIEGRLQLDQWTGQDGQKRSKLKLVLDNLQFLEPRSEAGGGEGGMRSPPSASMGRGGAASARPSTNYDDSPQTYPTDTSEHQGEQEIPF
jgi:single-strand DNA-binding protein